VRHDHGRLNTLEGSTFPGLTGGTFVELGLPLCDVEVEVVVGGLLEWDGLGGFVRSRDSQKWL
jgi:hypothetical protein